MKSIKKHIIALAVLGLTTQTGFAQTVIQPQPAANLFDGSATTNWVSSFNGETFPIDLEIQFGSTETFSQLMMRQVASTATDLADCKVDSFVVFIKGSATEAYPTTPAYTGRMSTSSTSSQWFTLTQTYSATHMLIRIYSLTGAESTNAALSELGIKAQKKNGSIASTTYDKDMPGTWTGIIWTTSEPYQATGINWSGKTLMTGDFNPANYALLGTNYNFTNTGINVNTGLLVLKKDESVKVVPTLVDNIISITSDSPIKKIAAITMNGIIYELSINNGTTNAGSLKSGQYIIIVVTEKGQHTQKIIKK